MRVVPSSPRVRRRQARLGAAFGLAGVVVAIALVVPSPKQPSSAPPKNAPPAEAVSQSTRVSRAERRAIDSTLDRFIPAALDRSSPATAWRLAGPELKSGSTLRQWEHGTSPIPYYPARGKTFHDWTTIDAGPGYVVFNLLVQPRRGSHTSAWVFSGRVVKRGSRWLVDGLYTIAVMQRPTKTGQHEVGPADFAAGAARTEAPVSNSSVLSRKWLGLIGGLVALVLVFPIGFAVVSVLRSRRRRRQLYGRPAARELPPLPRSVRTASGAREKAVVGGERH